MRGLESKAFFFKKKKQKTFGYGSEASHKQGQTFFGSFFQKSTGFL
jgi:hypothetical protein